MTWEQYWNEPAWLFDIFIEADKKRQERENSLAWLNGLYVYDAISSVAANILSKTNAQKAKYPEKPYDFSGEKKEPSQAEIKEKRQKMIAYLNKFSKHKR